MKNRISRIIISLLLFIGIFYSLNVVNPSNLSVFTAWALEDWFPKKIDIFPSIEQIPKTETTDAFTPSDNLNASIQITSPKFCHDLSTSGTVSIVGTTSDDKNDIVKVEAFAHTLPFNNEFNFKAATPTSPGDWSKWSIHLFIPDEKTYRILVRAVDKAGNEIWNESLINSEQIRQIQKLRKEIDSIDNGEGIKRIAFIKPTFTNAAYNFDSFYFFYYKYSSTPDDVAITKDLNLMTGEIPLYSEEDDSIMIPFIEHVQTFFPNSIVQIMRDENVHGGLIFTDDGRNVYDVLFLFHNEYVTQQEYDNLRKFVSNGGIIVFIDSNIFFAEVQYDKEECLVTLVKGHNWEFDGKVVRKGVWERYSDENTEWVGSNFINRDIAEPVIFDNNPFDYVHFEENEVTNPNVRILFDYGAKFNIQPETNPLIVGGLLKPDVYDDLGKTVATYELDSDSGKVIVLGLYAERLVNSTAFMDFFDKIILTRTLGTNSNLKVDGETFEVYWNLKNGKVQNMFLDKESKSLNLEINSTNGTSGNLLTLIIPKRLIDANTATKLANFIVFVDGREVSYSQSYDDIERGLAIALPADAKEVKVIGTQVIPEFSFTILVLAIVFSLPLLMRIFHPKSWRIYNF